jgi:hypothetical protein
MKAPLRSLKWMQFGRRRLRVAKLRGPRPPQTATLIGWCLSLVNRATGGRRAAGWCLWLNRRRGTDSCWSRWMVGYGRRHPPKWNAHLVATGIRSPAILACMAFTFAMLGNACGFVNRVNRLPPDPAVTARSTVRDADRGSWLLQKYGITDSLPTAFPGASSVVRVLDASGWEPRAVLTEIVQEPSDAKCRLRVAILAETPLGSQNASIQSPARSLRIGRDEARPIFEMAKRLKAVTKHGVPSETVAMDAGRVVIQWRLGRTDGVMFLDGDPRAYPVEARELLRAVAALQKMKDLAPP